MSFPTVIDNTMRKAFVQCPTQAMYRHVLNLRPAGEESEHLHFGSCFATGIEVARKSFFGSTPMSAQYAVEYGIDAAVAAWGEAYGAGVKTKVRLIGALRFYFEKWPLGEDGLVPLPNGIECRFDIKIPIRHPDTGEWLRYAGRYDMAATDRNGRIYIVDEKTTSRLGDSWAWQWDLDAQMTGYIWSKLYQNTEEYPDVEVVAQIRGLSILKNDYGHVEVPIVRPHWMIDRWYAQMLSDVRRMVHSYQSKEWDFALHSNACVAYNRPCDYTPLCCSPNPERLIDGAYKVVIWNPIEESKT